MTKGNYSQTSRRTRMASRSSRQFRRVKPRYRTRATRMPRQMKGLTKQVKELKRLAEADMGTHIHRVRSNVATKALDNLQSHISQTANSTALLETVLAQLRYYDPSNPSTLLQADGSAGTFQKDFYFTRVNCRIVLRNNYQVPALVKVYACVPKDDTSISPNTAYVNGLADIGGVSSNSSLMYLTDSVQFTDLWRIAKSKRTLLQPGSQCVLTWSAPNSFQYDPSLVDAHSLVFQKAYHGMVWQIFCQGVPAHDSTVETQQGISAAAVDIISETTFEVRYPAGADIKFITVVEGLDAFSNAAVVSNKPIADNQSYSLS